MRYQSEFSHVCGILCSGVARTSLVELRLSSSTSRLVVNNDGLLFAVVYEGLAGLFRKDMPASLVFGRLVCDLVAMLSGVDGFFTTDELPRYGVDQADLDEIVSALKIDARRDLAVLFAYDYSRSCKACCCLDQLLEIVSQACALGAGEF